MTVSTIPSDERVRDPFVHEALLYRDHATYLPYAMKFIYDGLAADEPVLVASPPANVRALRERLGAFAEAVRFADMTEAGRNPGRIIPWVLSMFMDEHAGRRVRIIGEPIWAGRSADEYPACVQHEAMINVAFSGREAAILCPYDVSRLDPQAVADCYGTHPITVEGTRRAPSCTYDPYGVTTDYNVPLCEPPPGATTFRFEIADLATVRRIVAAQATLAGLAEERTGWLQTAVNELATNSVLHGGCAGTLRTWYDHERIVCEVRDFGQLVDPMLGRLRPHHESGSGRGLVLVHTLVDLVQVHSSVTGTTTRVHMLLAARPSHLA